MKGFNLILGVFLFVFLVGTGFALDVGACRILDTQGSYVITNDLYGNLSYPATNACIFVNMSNVTIDGGGYALIGQNHSGQTTGIYVNTSIYNVTIKNFSIYNHTIGIYINSVVSPPTHDISIIGVRMYNLSNNSIYMVTNAQNITVNNSLFYNSGNGSSYGEGVVVLYDPSYVTLSNNTFYNQSGIGVYVIALTRNVLNVTLINNTFFSNSNYAISLFTDSGSIGNLSVIDNYIYNNQSLYFKTSAAGNMHYNITRFYIKDSSTAGQSYMRFNGLNYSGTASIALNSSNILLNSEWVSVNASSIGQFNSTATIQLYVGSYDNKFVYYNSSEFPSTKAAITGTGSTIVPAVNGEYLYFTATSFSGYATYRYNNPITVSSSSNVPPEEEKLTISMEYTVDCERKEVIVYFYNEDGDPYIIDDEYINSDIGLTAISVGTNSVTFEFSNDGSYKVWYNKASVSASKTIKINCEGEESKKDLYLYDQTCMIPSAKITCNGVEVKVVDDSFGTSPGSPQISDAVIALVDTAGTVVDTATTNANGIASLDIPTPGTYYVMLGDASTDKYNFACGPNGVEISTPDGCEEEGNEFYITFGEPDCLAGTVIAYFTDGKKSVMTDDYSLIKGGLVWCDPSYTGYQLTYCFGQDGTYSLSSGEGFIIGGETYPGDYETIEINCAEDWSTKPNVYFGQFCNLNLADAIDCENNEINILVTDISGIAFPGIDLAMSNAAGSVIDVATSESGGIANFFLPTESGTYLISLTDEEKELYNQMCPSISVNPADYCQEEGKKQTTVSCEYYDCDSGQLTLCLEFPLPEMPADPVTITTTNEDGEIVTQTIIKPNSMLELLKVKIPTGVAHKFVMEENDKYYMEDYVIKEIDACTEKYLSVDVIWFCEREDVFVTVTDQDGNQVDDAMVVVYNIPEGDVNTEYGSPDALGDGVYRFNMIVEGAQQFWVKSEDDLTASGYAYIECEDLDLIKGKGFKPEEEIPISDVPEDATVRVYGPDGNLVTVSNKDGKYSFTPLLAGNYTIEVNNDGAIYDQIIEILPPKTVDTGNAIKKFLDSIEGKIILLALLLISLVYWYQKRRAKQRAAKFKGMKK